MSAAIDGALLSGQLEAFAHGRETSEPAPRRGPLDQLRHALRIRRYCYRTDRADVGWVPRYALFPQQAPFCRDGRR